MAGYALLSEIYNDEDLKPKKRGKKKKKPQSNVPIVPMRPQEMDTELLDDEPESHIQQMKSSPYDPVSQEYQRVQPRDYIMDNTNIMKPYQRPLRRLGPHPNATVEHDDDPEYLEFLEFKKGRREALLAQQREMERESTLTSSGDQFNELLLYMFTGFFLLILYDNIYKLGRDSY